MKGTLLLLLGIAFLAAGTQGYYECWHNGIGIRGGEIFQKGCEECRCLGGGKVEVLSTKFGCNPSRCTYRGHHYADGESVRFGLQQCKCAHNGTLSCFRRGTMGHDGCWHNGRLINWGHSFQDGCRTCSCEGGNRITCVYPPSDLPPDLLIYLFPLGCNASRLKMRIP